ncbi:MAG: NAD-dependent epimerase/dehydratase family protein [Candidatus Sumerlaeota bacterium]|nr:NAD-dependent epimerase/dehydratase family protein [Candidatus Sumerlaeota bacterium]
MKRVLITGATGFIGANLVRRLLKEGHALHLLVRPGYQSWRIAELLDDARLYEADLQDEDRIGAVLGGVRPEWIFHLAAYGGYSWQTETRQIYQTIFLGTVHLLEACLKTGFEAFINAGSSSEYGLKDHAPAENEWLEPNSHYAVAKASATLYCLHEAQARNANIQTLRLYSAYGPFEAPGRLMPTLIVRGLKSALPPLVNPATARDFIYVEDVVEAFLMAASQPPREPGAVYNVGSGVQTTLREVVELARRMLRISAEPQWGTMKDRTWDTNVWIADIRRILSELGWRPRFDLQSGFKAMLRWLQENPQYHGKYCE